MNEIIKCINCQYWNGDRAPLPEGINLTTDWREGVCVKIGAFLDIQIHAGWDGGTVGDIKTLSQFGCVLGQPIVLDGKGGTVLK